MKTTGAESVRVDVHQGVGRGEDRFVERPDGRLTVVANTYERMAWKLHACAPRGGTHVRDSGGPP